MARVRRTIPLALLLVAAGCSSGSKHDAQPVAGPAVPWTAATPAQVAERPAVSRACRAGDLKVQGRVRFVPRLDGGIALPTIRNTSEHACRLTGRPRVTFVKQGGPVQIDRPVPPTPSNFPEVTYPESSLLGLRPGETAALTITWDNWCDPIVKGKPHVPPSALRITLPSGRGRLDADYNAVPPCVDPTAPTTIGVSRFQVSLVPSGKPWSSAFLQASVPGQPVHAQRGGVLRFRVVLKNRSRTTARFSRCPAYIQQLAPAGRVEAYRLNCEAAHPIRPGKSLAFAMRLRVPKNAPLGANGLFWELDPFGAGAPEVHARVTIDKD
jgi:hypothetical protein